MIKPSGVSMGFLKAGDLIVIDLYGNKVEGEQAPSIETPLHTAIYRARSDVQGVVHTRAPFSTAFGIAGTEIIPLQVEMFLYIPNGVPIVPFELPGSKELAEWVKFHVRRNRSPSISLARRNRPREICYSYLLCGCSERLACGQDCHGCGC